MNAFLRWWSHSLFPPLGTFGLICQEHTKYITMAQGVVASAIIVLLVMGLWNVRLCSMLLFILTQSPVQVEDVIGLKDELKIDMLTIVPTFGLWVIFCNAGEPAYPFTSLHLANLAIFQWFCATIIMPVVWSYRTQVFRGLFAPSLSVLNYDCCCC